MDFVGTERITGDILAPEIKKTLTKFGLDFQDCRGQGYDRVTNMSSVNGVRDRLSAEKC